MALFGQDSTKPGIVGLRSWVGSATSTKPGQFSWLVCLSEGRETELDWLYRKAVVSAVIMDVFTRSIRGWHLGRSLDQSLTLIALDRALAEHKPEIHHSDQGSQYAATTYIQKLRAADAKVSMAECGQAWQNGYAERLVRTIKEEEVDLSDYDDYTDAVCQLGRFLNDVYMHNVSTPHWAISRQSSSRNGGGVTMTSLPVFTKIGPKSVQFHGVTSGPSYQDVKLPSTRWRRLLPGSATQLAGTSLWMTSSLYACGPAAESLLVGR